MCTICVYKDNKKPESDVAVPFPFDVGGGFSFCTSPVRPRLECEGPDSSRPKEYLATKFTKQELLVMRACSLVDLSGLLAIIVRVLLTM